MSFHNCENKEGLLQNIVIVCKKSKFYVLFNSYYKPYYLGSAL